MTMSVKKLYQWIVWRRSYVFGVAIVVSCLARQAMGEPSIFPTGVTRYDPKLSYNSYVLFDTPDSRTVLIDMDGREIHSWPKAGFPSVMLPPTLAAGHPGDLLVQLQNNEVPGNGLVPGEPAEFHNRVIGELNWQGKVIWSWGPTAPGGAAKQHHDEERLANGDTLVLANLLHSVRGFAQKVLLDDVIYEVTAQGEVTWRWVASEHLTELGFNRRELALLRASPHADYLHMNAMTALGPNRWEAAGDKRFAPDNIMIESRNANFIAIIDKRMGHIVWEIGPDYPKVPWPPAPLPRPVDQMSGVHDAHLVQAGLPGAGNLLVFDNQGEAGYPPVDLRVTGGSRVLEINPETKQIVWQYVGDDDDRPSWSFHSYFLGSAQRLPNGNTLINEGMNGRLFQVTTAGRIVWEYVSPYFAKAWADSYARWVMTNWVYRAYAVPYGWVPARTRRGEKAVIPSTLPGGDGMK